MTNEKKANKTGSKRTQTGKRKDLDRREFLRTTVMASGVVGFSLLNFLPVIQGSSLQLRPPGALKPPSDEKVPIGADCTRCGMCLDICPASALEFKFMDLESKSDKSQSV